MPDPALSSPFLDSLAEEGAGDLAEVGEGQSVIKHKHSLQTPTHIQTLYVHQVTAANTARESLVSGHHYHIKHTGEPTV